jgi:hypothetical protein
VVEQGTNEKLHAPLLLSPRYMLEFLSILSFLLHIVHSEGPLVFNLTHSAPKTSFLPCVLAIHSFAFYAYSGLSSSTTLASTFSSIFIVNQLHYLLPLTTSGNPTLVEVY